MIPDIIKINKSMSGRLEEYQELLEEIDNPSIEMVETWSSIFEDLSIIGVDWKALWILTEEYCDIYNLLFPTAVIVNVDGFDWQFLEADVSVIGVQEDIILPSQLKVPIIDLHPIKHQNYREDELRNIEDWLDKCRYFFKNLWYPWDEKLNASIKDWCKNHLKKRLILQFNLKNKVFDPTVENYLRSLLEQARNFDLVAKRSYQAHEDENLTSVRALMHRKILKTELNLFEEPESRKGIILLKSKQKFLKDIQALKENKCNEARIVWTNGTSDSFFKYVQDLKLYLGSNVDIKVFDSLEKAMDDSYGNATILLPSGHHTVNKFKGVDVGGVIKGFTKEDTIIIDDISFAPKAILFDCFGSYQLENLTLQKSAGTIIQVFNGIVKLCNCKLLAKKSSSKGVVVFPGCKLYLENCELEGFGTGLILKKGSQAFLINTKIFNCIEGIKVADNVSLTMDSVDISSCFYYAIRMETTKIDSKKLIAGDLDLLKKYANCQIKSVTFSKNRKGNVLVRKSDENVNYLDELEEDNSDVIIIDDSSDDVDKSSAAGETGERWQKDDLDETRKIFERVF